MRRETRVALLLIGCVIAGALSGVSAMPVVFRFARTEASRIETVMRALLRSPAPPVVVTGDSVVMYGIDGRLLSQELGLGQPVWNLGTPGQDLAEVLIVADALPASVKTLVVGLTSESLDIQPVDFDADLYSSYVMSGYRPSADAMAIASRMSGRGLLAKFKEPWWRNVIRSRWVLRASVDHFLRVHVRRDLTIDFAQTELDQPVTGARVMEPDEKRRSLEGLRSRKRFAPTADRSAVLLRINELLARRGQRLIVVLVPDHPRLRARSDPHFYEQRERWLMRMRREGLVVEDFHDLLSEEELFDHVHPTVAGARRLTQALAQRLAAP